MKRFLMMMLALLLAFAATACTAQPAPTEAPAANPTEAPAVFEPTEAPVSDPTEAPQPTEAPEALSGPLKMTLPALSGVSGDPTEEINARSALCYMVDDAALVITAAYNGVQPLDGLMAQRFEELLEVETVAYGDIQGLATEGMRFTVGTGSDACVVDAVAVYSDSDTYTFMSIVTADVYAGNYDATVAGWIESITMALDS